MPIYKPTELLKFLEELGIAPKKGLSQNFLIDGNILNKIVATADIKPDDLVLEIGPGPGSLTEILLNQGAHVIAVEKDAVLAAALQRLQTADNRLQIYCNDILTFPVEKIISEKIAKGKRAKVVANLPYHLTTPILIEFVTKHHLFSHLIVMVQDEVARRFAAQPGTSEYGSFTVFLNYYSKPKYAFTVSNNCFFPAPKVNSAIVVLELQEPPQVSNEEGLFELTRKAFSQRRKMLRSSLRDLYKPDDVEMALTKMSLSPLSRPEVLSLNEFISLYNLLNKN